jgi:hypothetical protein
MSPLAAVKVGALRCTPSDSSSATPYPTRIPDGEYLAVCTNIHRKETPHRGDRIYLRFKICEGDHTGEIIPMYLTPSKWPTSNLYRAWSIARGGPPRSRNTKLDPRIFFDKLFRVLTTTVKPHQQIVSDGKIHRGPELPEPFWYSRVACLLSLEIDSSGGLCPPGPPLSLSSFQNKPETPDIVTASSRNPFLSISLSEGRVGCWELGVRGLSENSVVAVGDGQANQSTNHAGPTEKSAAPAPSPRDEFGAWQQRQAERDPAVVAFKKAHGL